MQMSSAWNELDYHFDVSGHQWDKTLRIIVCAVQNLLLCIAYFFFGINVKKFKDPS
jgi:hypothetical protein